MDSLGKLDVKKKIAVLPEKKYNDIKGISDKGIGIETVPAYTVNTEFHPKSQKWVGYIVAINSIYDSSSANSKINSKKFYHAGDTGNIPEFSSETFADIDVAFLPVDGVYAMGGVEAAMAANTFRPKLAIPIHYGTIVCTIEGANQLKENCVCKVEIPEIK